MPFSDGQVKDPPDSVVVETVVLVLPTVEDSVLLPPPPDVDVLDSRVVVDTIDAAIEYNKMGILSKHIKKKYTCCSTGWDVFGSFALQRNGIKGALSWTCLIT